MLTAVVVIGVGLAAGIPWPVLAVAALAVWQPVFFLILVAVWVLWSRRGKPDGDAEASFLSALAAELRAGASLRHGLMAAAHPDVELDLTPLVRSARLGRPASEMAVHLEAALPENGALAGAAVEMVAETGASAAATFAALAVRAAEAADDRRQAQALSAHVRLSAWVVGLAPAATWLLLAVTGRAGALFDHGPAGALVLGVGLALEIAGASSVWLMVRRAAVP
ncbi:MAG: type II secretion system F family protein [Acidimicrobiia bacterium]